MKIPQLPLLAVSGLLLASAAQAIPSVTYYYNSSDSNPNDFQGSLSIFPLNAGQPLPFLQFDLTAVINGETVEFTGADQIGTSQGVYATNPDSDPLTILGLPTYDINDPLLGGIELDLSAGSGSPTIDQLSTSPTVVLASDVGEWLLSPPPPPDSGSPVPDGASTLLLLGVAFGGLAVCRRGRASISS